MNEIIHSCSNCHRKMLCRGHKDGSPRYDENPRRKYSDVCACPICNPKTRCILEFLPEKPRKGRLIGGYSIQ